SGQVPAPRVHVGSPGQAERARTQLWQLWAVSLGVPDPQYGLTSILDFAPGQVPPSFESTVADLDPGRLRDAARRVAIMLNEVGIRLPDDQRAVLPSAKIGRAHV